MGGRCLFSLAALLLCPFHVLADYCEYPLVEESVLTASSELVTREADKARLYGRWWW